jgi:hypothetical protein
MADIRKGEVTFKGNPITLVGPKLKPGDKAPDFTAVGAGLAKVSLGDTAGKARLFNVVPSLDTPVCNTQTRRFAEELKASICRLPRPDSARKPKSKTSRTCLTPTITALANITAS